MLKQICLALFLVGCSSEPGEQSAQTGAGADLQADAGQCTCQNGVCHDENGDLCCGPCPAGYSCMVGKDLLMQHDQYYCGR